jgi:peptidoglycan/LPS O-acetylase OafA/YrhL
VAGTIVSASPAARDAGAADVDTAGRIRVLDGVRGIAILLVLMLHFALYGGTAPRGGADRIAFSLLSTGWIGVDLFFVLSGFLITGILYRTKDERHYFRNFYMRRVLRIFPLYYATLALFAIVLPAIWLGTVELRSVSDHATSFWLYLTNIRIARAGWAPSDLLGHFWSLAVEEQFYLVWPFIVFACSRKALLRVCAGILIACPLVRIGLHSADSSLAAYVLTPARLDSLAIGGLVALIAEGRGGLERLARRAPALLGGGLAVTAGLVVARPGLPYQDAIVGTIGYSVLAVLFAALIARLLTAPQDGRLARTFGSSWLRFFGRYSYALYVFHHPLLFLLPAWWSIDAFRPAGTPWLLGYCLFVVATLPVCVGLSLLSWHAVELPFLRLKDRFPAGRSSRRRGEVVGPTPVASGP